MRRWYPKKLIPISGICRFKQNFIGWVIQQQQLSALPIFSNQVADYHLNLGWSNYLFVKYRKQGVIASCEFTQVTNVDKVAQKLQQPVIQDSSSSRSVRGVIWNCCFVCCVYRLVLLPVCAMHTLCLVWSRSVSRTRTWCRSLYLSQGKLHVILRSTLYCCTTSTFAGGTTSTEVHVFLIAPHSQYAS